MNRSNFSAFGSVGSTRLPRVAPLQRNVRDLLLRDVERQRVLQPEHPLEERHVESVHGDAARPEPQAALFSISTFVCLRGDVAREVAVLDHAERAVDHREIAELVLGRRLRDRHRRQLALGEEVVAEELRVADRH